MTYYVVPEYHFTIYLDDDIDDTFYGLIKATLDIEMANRRMIARLSKTSC